MSGGRIHCHIGSSQTSQFKYDYVICNIIIEKINFSFDLFPSLSVPDGYFRT